MATDVMMPQLSDTMSDGKILRWLKNEGDKVTRGEALAEVATDKADLEIESFHEGTLLKQLAKIGDTVKVGAVIAIIGEAGESVASAAATPAQNAPSSSQSQSNGSTKPPTTPAPVAVSHASSPTAQISGADRIKISPLARNIAQNAGIDIHSIQGSGDGGRIVRRDVEAAQGQVQRVESVAPVAPPVAPAARPAQTFVPTTPSVAAPAAGSGYSTEPLSKMRETIAQRMVESVNTMPHFYVTAKIYVDTLAKMRESLKTLGQYEGLTYNHLMIKAAGIALRAHPRVNSHYKAGQLVQPQAINVGIITAVADGLLIPVVKNADALSLADIVAEARGLVQRARSGRPKADDLVGGTFSISNLGIFPVQSFTAIINPGQGAILAVSGIQEEPIAVDGEVRVGKTVCVTLSVDHRIIDGVVASEFLTEFKRVLEDPVLLLA